MQVEAMADIHHHLLESVDHDDGEEGFTFAAVSSPLAAVGETDGRIGPVYPIFGRPRSPPLLLEQQQEEGEDPTSSATVRVPLGQLLLEERERGSSSSPLDDDGGELDGVPAETYCLWSPGGSPASVAAGPHQSPRPRCEKSGSTGSVLRWRQRLLGRSNSDGKDKFVYILNTISSSGGGANEGDGRRSSTSFLPCNRKDLVGLFANAAAFRRSYHPF